MKQGMFHLWINIGNKPNFYFSSRRKPIENEINNLELKIRLLLFQGLFPVY